MFGSSLPPAVCRSVSYLRCVCLHILVFITYCVVVCFLILLVLVLCALCCKFLWIVLFFIAPSVFSNVYLQFLYTCNVIDVDTKVLLCQAWVTLADFWLFCLVAMIFLFSSIFEWFIFLVF